MLFRVSIPYIWTWLKFCKWTFTQDIISFITEAPFEIIETEIELKNLHSACKSSQGTCLCNKIQGNSLRLNTSLSKSLCQWYFHRGQHRTRRSFAEQTIGSYHHESYRIAWPNENNKGLYSLSARVLYWSYRSDNWKTTWYHCCRGACQISERFEKYKHESRGFETSWYLVVRRTSA